MVVFKAHVGRSGCLDELLSVEWGYGSRDIIMKTSALLAGNNEVLLGQERTFAILPDNTVLYNT